MENPIFLLFFFSPISYLFFSSNLYTFVFAVELHLFHMHPHVLLLVCCSCADVKCNGQIPLCIIEVFQGKLEVSVNRLYLWGLSILWTVSLYINLKPDWEGTSHFVPSLHKAGGSLKGMFEEPYVIMDYYITSYKYNNYYCPIASEKACCTSSC